MSDLRERVARVMQEVDRAAVAFNRAPYGDAIIEGMKALDRARDAIGVLSAALIGETGEPVGERRRGDTVIVRVDEDFDAGEVAEQVRRCLREGVEVDEALARLRYFVVRLPWQRRYELVEHLVKIPGVAWIETNHIVSLTANAVAPGLTPLYAAPPSGGPGWRPIETAPRDGTAILVARLNLAMGWVVGHARWERQATGHADALMFGTRPRVIEGWLSRGFTDPPGNLGLSMPSHWMPLPAPPTTKGDSTR